MERIDFNITELENEKAHEVIEAFVCLHEKYFEYKIQYYCDQNDEALGWERGVWHDYHEISLKESITSMSCGWREKINQWKVMISIQGMADDTYIMFLEEKKAKDLFNKIKAWRFDV